MTPTVEAAAPVAAPTRPRSAPDASATAAPSRLRPVLAIAGIALVVVAVLVWRGFFAGAVPDNIVALSGRIEGDESVVSPKTGGRIVNVHVREGDTVKAGDI